MACSHNNNHSHIHHPRTCCCNTPPPSLPSPAVDPILLQSIVSQLLQIPQAAQLYSAAPTPAVDFHPGPSQYLHHRIQKRPKQKQPQSDQYSDLTSLLRRIDLLESALNRFSPATHFSLRHVAARTIQIHFRAHLVRKSRALTDLKELASIKSALNLLKSFVSLQQRIDFFALSHEALDLIRRLENIQSGDQMVRDSKRSIRRDVAGFLELIDEICAKRTTVSVKTVKHIRMARNDNKSRASNAGRDISEAYHRDKPSKRLTVDSDEKRQIAKLRERVERIQHMSRGLINEEDSVDLEADNGSGAYHRGKYLKQGNVGSSKKKLIDNLRERVQRIQHLSKNFKDGDDSADSDDDNDADRSKIYTNGFRRGDVTAKHRSPAEKHVWFAEDGKVSCNAVRREESVDNQYEEDGEMESDFMSV